MTGATVAVPLTASGRVRPLAWAGQTLPMAWRSPVAVKHNPLELVDYSVTPIMFVFLFTYVLGGQMAGSTDAYLMYALPGIIVQNTLFMTVYTAMALNTDLTKGVFDRLRSLPMARSAPLIGRITADLAKHVWAMLLVIGIGVLMGFRITGGFGGFLLGAVLLVVFAAAASWSAVLIGMLAGDAEKVQAFSFTVIFPISFTSSAFVVVDTMPAGCRRGATSIRSPTCPTRTAGCWSAARWRNRCRGRWCGLSAQRRCSARWRCGRTGRRSEPRPHPRRGAGTAGFAAAAATEPAGRDNGRAARRSPRVTGAPRCPAADTVLSDM